MHSYRDGWLPLSSTRVAIGVGVILASCTGIGSRTPSPSVTVPVGSWLCRGPKTVLGRGHDAFLEFFEANGAMQVRRTVLSYPEVGRGDVAVNNMSPVPVVVDGVKMRCGQEKAVTFRVDGKHLVFPAVVEEWPGSWLFEGGDHQAVHFVCDADPRHVARGHARFPSGSPKPVQTYVASTDPATGALVRVAFFERFGDEVRKQCTLVWDPTWGLMFEGSSWFRVEQRWFERFTSAVPR